MQTSRLSLSRETVRNLGVVGYRAAFPTDTCVSCKPCLTDTCVSCQPCVTDTCATCHPCLTDDCQSNACSKDSHCQTCHPVCSHGPGQC